MIPISSCNVFGLFEEYILPTIIILSGKLIQHYALQGI